MRGVWAAASTVMISGVALATPGPDSVAIVGNANRADSIALARRYRDARAVPMRQLCLLDLPTEDTIDLQVYLDRFETPFEACLSDAIDRIEAVVLARGVPLRVTMPTANGGQRTSLAAALSIWKSTLQADGERLLGEAPGVAADCNGTPCTAARFQNPFTTGSFEPGYRAQLQGVDYQLLIVTMLHGRSYADAAKLIASATTADAIGGASGQFLLMNGGDNARAILDIQYPFILNELGDRGLDVERVPYDRAMTGRTMAAFFVGTSGLDETIEGNTFLPGALVDNVTSFGAVPENFGAPEDERQVSIARWVANGIAGVHGTTDEPLSNSFPSRYLIVDYVDGGTLGEAYFRHLPFAYWRNLVLGDPMTAPYANRPVVEITGPGATVEGAFPLEVSAAHADGVEYLRLFVDGELIAEGTDTLSRCLVLEEGDVEVLAVAQATGDHRPKGWSVLRTTVLPGWPDCEGPPPDAGFVDAARSDAGSSVDAGFSDGGPKQPPAEEEGCGCSAAPTDHSGAVTFALAGLFAFRRRRRRRRPAPPGPPPAESAPRPSR